MVERREGHFRGEGGLELFFQSWTNQKARGNLIITHGIGEHSECYQKTAESLVPLGWNIYAWDLRGHGRSEGKRGYIEDFRTFSLDLSRFLGFLESSGHLKLPFALIGHSMGGLITLRYWIDNDSTSPKPGAMVLSSPLLGVALAVPPVKDVAARVLAKVMPSMTLYNEIKYSDLTRDPEYLKTYELDPLRHDRISAPLYLGMFENIEYVKNHADQIRLPTLIQIAGKEKIVSRPATEAFFPMIGSKNKKLIVYEESHHEIYNDLDRKEVFQDLHAFVSEALGV